jgi:Zn-dependent protease with chaperone function
MKHNIAIKYIAVGSAVALFLGLTIWLVRNEGQRTRESIREAAKDAGGEVRKGLVEGAERVVDRAAEVPGKIVRDVTKEVVGEGSSAAKQVVGEAGRLSREVLGEIKDTLRPLEKPDAKAPAPAAGEKPPAPSPSAAMDEKEPAPATSQGDSAAKSKPLPGKKPARRDDPIGMLFDLGHQVSKAVDEVGQEVLALSWEEEQQVGREVHQMVAREHKLLRPPAVIERLQQLAKPIVNQRTRKEVTFTLEVIQSDEINAFAHAGGYVYVNTGMLNFSKPDAELQFFLAHEIAHQELKHVVKRMTYAARASQLGGQAASTLAQMAYLTIAIGYSKEQELEADAWAFRALLRAGRNRDEALSAMRRMLAYVNKKDLEPTRSKARNPAEDTLQQIENHFRSHPPTAERLKQMEAIRE